MIKQPYANISFDWLGDNFQSGLTIFPSEQDFNHNEYELPNNYGKGSIQTLNLALGMTIFRAEHQFEEKATGHSIPTGSIKVEMNEPTFQAQIIRGGRVLEIQIDPVENLLLSPGIDLFRYSTKYEISPSLDGSSNSQMTCISIGQTMLQNLIGDEETNNLLTTLNLIPYPRVIAKEVPLYISSHLHTAINASLTGNAQKLNCQARVLDYLALLVEHTQQLNNNNSQVDKKIIFNKNRSHQVRDYLLNIEGKLPTLDLIANLFNCSARTLNEEFIAEFGESIYSFITNQRLLAAHSLIKNNPIALKEISFRLGYAHVNHFSAAFKNKFGYPPGSLRKKS